MKWTNNQLAFQPKFEVIIKWSQIRISFKFNNFGRWKDRKRRKPSSTTGYLPWAKCVALTDSKKTYIIFIKAFLSWSFSSSIFILFQS